MRSKGLLNDNDSQNLIKFGTHLITKGLALIKVVQPFDSSRGLINWQKQYEGNTLLYVGVEFLIKGIFLKKGFAVNAFKETKLNSRVEELPVKMNRSKSKLDAAETRKLVYFLKHIDLVADFDQFDKEQAARNSQPAPQPKPGGLLSTRYKNPDHNQIFEYIRLTRNSYLHTSKHMETFNGIYTDIERLIDYMCKKALNKNLSEISDLKNPFV